MKKSAAELNKELFDKISIIKLNDAAAIFGTTSKESMLQALRKSIAELGTALAEKQDYDKVIQAHEAVAGNLDTAGVTGIISEDEMTGYYKLLDDIWSAIEKENK